MSKTADEVVDALFRDMNGRKGFHVNDLPGEVYDEIRAAFLAIVAGQVTPAPPGDPPWVIVTDAVGMGMRRPPGIRIMATESAARSEVARVALARGLVLVHQDVSADVDGQGIRFAFGETLRGPATVEVLMLQRAVRA